ncbi:TniB family NTP-binding protein [Undibacterium luofuense]|uniref:TniB family NTP-binding protein n=1 Tax=Undibacterium luofuense TaxID=2828733 RepID=A0A941DQ94_9BURK|nr:TniB family NTP-binding protein [Undibacterium luofuense]MBR7782116.1 TniB family NTP-binding protein [Undibacterium luofuense]
MKEYHVNDDFYAHLRECENHLIPHKNFAKVVKRLEYVMEVSVHGAESRHTLLVGESGAGKTWIARYLQFIYPANRQDGNMVMPILYVETPAVPTLKGLAEAILVSLGDPIFYRGTASDKRRRALEFMRECKVQLIIFDEFQHFYDHGRNQSLLAVADWLKLFIEDANRPCLLMGLPRCENILHVNEQLRRRFSTRLELSAFSIDSENGEIEFRSLLKEMEITFSKKKTSGLAEVDLARRIYFACNGLIGYLKKLLIGAFEIMISENKISLDCHLLEQAFVQEIWRDGVGVLNPFNDKFKFRRLNQQGEPFSGDTSTFTKLNSRRR